MLLFTRGAHEEGDDGKCERPYTQEKEIKESTEVVYDRVFPLSSLWKHAGKWGHTWREMDEGGEQWNEQDVFILYIFLCFVWLV